MSTLTRTPESDLPPPTIEQGPQHGPSSRWPVLWLAVAVLAFPVGNISVPGLGVALILPVTAAAITLAALTRFAAHRPAVGRSPVLALAAGTVVAGALAVGAAPDPALAVRVTGTAVIGLGLAAVTAAACHRPRHWAALVAVLLAVGGGVCAASLGSAGPLQAAFDGAVVSGRLTGVFVQPNELGMFAAVITVLALAVLGSSRRPAALLGALAVLAAAVPALALSLSRGAWLGAAGGVLVLVVCAAGARRRLAAILLLAVLAWTALALAAPQAQTTTQTAGPLATLAERATSILAPQDDPYDERPAIWREAVRQIEDAPLLGHGPGNFPVVAAGASASAPGIEADHAHDLALTTAAETGLVGLAFLAASVLAGMVAVARVARRRGAPPRAAAAAAALAVVLVHGIVDYPLRNAVLAMLAWLLVGLLVAATASGRDDCPDAAAGGFSPAAGHPVLAATAAGLLVFAAGWAYTQRQPTTYTATAVLAVAPRPGTAGSAADVMLAADTYLAYVSSAPVADVVAGGLGRTGSPLAAASTTVRPPDTANLQITAKLPDARQAVRAANALAAAAVARAAADRRVAVEVVSPASDVGLETNPPRRLMLALAAAGAVAVGAATGYVLRRRGPARPPRRRAAPT